MHNRWTSNFVNLLVLSLLPVGIVFHAFVLPPAISVAGITDSGFVSIVTLSFIVSAFIVILTLIFNTQFAISKLAACAGAYCVLIYFMREADFHRLFTIEHVTRWEFYFMGIVPVWQKFVAILVFTILALSIIYLLAEYAKFVWKKIKVFEPWANALLLWFVVLAISQLCDRSDINHLHLGRVIEEYCECWAAIFLFLAVTQLIPYLNIQNQDVSEA